MNLVFSHLPSPREGMFVFSSRMGRVRVHARYGNGDGVFRRRKGPAAYWSTRVQEFRDHSSFASHLRQEGSDALRYVQDSRMLRPADRARRFPTTRGLGQSLQEAGQLCGVDDDHRSGHAREHPQFPGTLHMLYCTRFWHMFGVFLLCGVVINAYFVQESSGCAINRISWGCGRSTPAHDWIFVTACAEAPFQITMKYRGDYIDTRVSFNVHIARLDGQVLPLFPFPALWPK